MNNTFLKRTISLIISIGMMSLYSFSAHALLVTKNITGLWDLPDQERHGMTITVSQLTTGEKTVIAYLAAFDQMGQPTWLFAQGEVNGDNISGPLFKVSGPAFLDPRGTPSNFEQVGTMDIAFSDCNNGLVSFQTPMEVIGTGGFRIQRISNLFRTRCTGGTVDDVPSSVMVTEFEVFLNNTGLDADASGKAEFEERPDRTEFSVEIEDLAAGDYDLLVDGIIRASITVNADNNGGTEGEVEFRSPAEPGKILLDFEPRGALLEITQAAAVYLSSNLPAQGMPPPPPSGNGQPPPFANAEIEIDLTNQGVIAGAEGDAQLEQRVDRVDFDVEIEDLPVGDYTLFVEGIERATINVVDTPSGTEGEAEFRFPAEPGKLLLDFDPRGQSLSIQQNGIEFLAAGFPLMGDGDDDDSGGGDDDDNSGGGDDDDDDSSGNGGDAGLTITIGFNNIGPDADANGSADYEERTDRTDFNVEVDDLDDGVYELRVGGSSVAMMIVTGGEGEVEFRNPSEPGKLELDFDPLGQTVEVVQNSTVFLSLTMPNP